MYHDIFAFVYTLLQRNNSNNQNKPRHAENKRAEKKRITLVLGMGNGRFVRYSTLSLSLSVSIARARQVTEKNGKILYYLEEGKLGTCNVLCLCMRMCVCATTILLIFNWTTCDFLVTIHFVLHCLCSIARSSFILLNWKLHRTSLLILTLFVWVSMRKICCDIRKLLLYGWHKESVEYLTQKVRVDKSRAYWQVKHE